MKTSRFNYQQSTVILLLFNQSAYSQESIKVVTLGVSQPIRLNLQLIDSVFVSINSSIDLDTIYSIEDNYSHTHQWLVINDHGSKRQIENTIKVTQDSLIYLFVTDDHIVSYYNSSKIYSIDEVIALEPISLSNQINIFPNPNNGNFECDLVNHQKGNYRLEIVNILGELLYMESFIHDSNSINKSVKTDLPNGIYVLYIKDQQHILFRQMLVVK